jgi:uncharacterized protein YrrD
MEARQMNAIGTEKRIDIGADVAGSDGNKVGTVAYVVVRPTEMQITDIVVSTGAILGRDIVLPLDVVSAVEDGTVQLSIDKNQVDSYPDYVEVNYQQPPTGWIPPAGTYYPPTGILWPSGYEPDVASVRINAPPGTVGIGQGMEVESSDGHKVGSVDALETDPTSGDVTGFVVKHGFLFTKDTRMPMTDVSGVREGKVILNVTKDQVESRERASSRT